MKTAYIYMTGLVIAVLDQITKLIVVSRIPYGSSVPVLGDILHFSTQRNTGGAFGLFSSFSGMLILITVIVIAAIIVISHRQTSIPGLAGVAFALQLGGAAGNLVDRIRLGYVVDFVNFHFWPVFNLADSAITIGILLLIYYLIFVDGRKAIHPSDTNAEKD